MAKSSFQGKFLYYENINGKSKKIEKNFTDQKKFNDFVKKYSVPKIEIPKFDFGLLDNMKSLFNDFVDINFPRLFDIKGTQKKALIKKQTPIKKTISSKKIVKKKK